MRLALAFPLAAAFAVAAAASVVRADSLAAEPAAEEVIDRIAASVDEVAISESEVRKAMAVSAISPQTGEAESVFRGRVLDALIDQRLQYREAQRFAPATPEPAAVDAAMKRLRERLQAAGRDPAAEFAAAGMTVDEVRAALERQIVVQNYLQERFRPIAVADEDRAREEYAKRYVPGRRAAGLKVETFEAVADEMRRQSQQRIYDEEAAKWMKEIRQKAQVAIFTTPLPVSDAKPIPLPAEKRLPPAPASKAPTARQPD